MSSFPALASIAAPSPFLRNQVALTTLPSSSLRSYPNLNRSNRFCVNRSYAQANIREDFKTAPIDVVADVKAERIVILGGSGFVGSAICRAAVSKGIEAVSLSRSGQPSYSDSWVDQVTWIKASPMKFEVRLADIYLLQTPHKVPLVLNLVKRSLICTGDVFYANWDEILVGATAVVSTIGGFGNEEQMKRINGEANVLAVDVAKEYGVPKFILISVHDYNLPSFLLSSGYFTGKRKAESEVLSKYSNSGAVLRPGFIYGKRRVDSFEIPLDIIGEPLEKFLKATENLTKPLTSLPASDLLFAPPVSVDDVAFAVINAVIDDDFFGIFTIEQIKEAAAKVRA